MWVPVVDGGAVRPCKTMREGAAVGDSSRLKVGVKALRFAVVPNGTPCRAALTPTRRPLSGSQADGRSRLPLVNGAVVIVGGDAPGGSYLRWC
jgi:hypothetical protein